MQALPTSTYFLFLEAAAGGTIALLWLHLRGGVSRGFLLFTAWCLLGLQLLAIWLRGSFPPAVVRGFAPDALLWFGAERAVCAVLAACLFVFIVSIQRGWAGLANILAPPLPLLALGALWTSAFVEPNNQIFGFAAPLTVLAGAFALGTALTGLSLGHWYLVAPSLAVRPLVEVTFLCLGAIGVQAFLIVVALVFPGDSVANVRVLTSDYSVLFGVRVLFGLIVPAIACVMTWRTARIRSLDSATGILYIIAALVLAGEIVARTLYFLTGVAV